MKKFLYIFVLILTQTSLAQPWSADGICDYTDGQQWNSGGSKGCACSWYSTDGVDTLLNCAFGDCGQNALYECVYDCNGHNGFITDMIARTCDGTATPVCWFNGAGSAGQLFCEGIALSVELIDFIGIKDGRNNILTWRTASELNADYYILQNSTDGYNYMTVSILPANGNSTSELKYNAIHLNPELTINYYRLIQYDIDGQFEQFETIVINNSVLQRQIVSRVNLLGQEVDEYYDGMVIIHYDDGAIEKKFQ